MKRRDLIKSMLGLPAILLVPELARANHPIEQIESRTAALEADLDRVIHQISPADPPFAKIASQRSPGFDWVKDQLTAVSDHEVEITEFLVVDGR